MKKASKKKKKVSKAAPRAKKSAAPKRTVKKQKSKKTTLKRKTSPKKSSKKTPLRGSAPIFKPAQALGQQQNVEMSKFTAVQDVYSPQAQVAQEEYNLPSRYADDQIVLLPRDPWWMYTYWDISENRINQIVSSIAVTERENLKWTIRVYDVTGIRDFRGDNARSSFDLDINVEASSWYININQPESEWCVEIGLKNPAGKFFALARSNIVRIPYFGISSVIDEEWALPDDEFFKVMGMFDIAKMGKSSLEKTQLVERHLQKQISSPMASWGGSNIGIKKQDDFFLEVWTELILYGRTAPDADVKVEGKKANLRPDGTFSLRYALNPGDFTYEVKATSANKKHKRRKAPAVKRFDKK